MENLGVCDCKDSLGPVLHKKNDFCENWRPGTVVNGEFKPLSVPEKPRHAVGETVVLSEGQHAEAAKPKRKYTRRAKKSEPSDYQQRVIAELQELNEKRVKLATYLASLPSPAQMALLADQQQKMTELAEILKKRIDNFEEKA